MPVQGAGHGCAVDEDAGVVDAGQGEVVEGGVVADVVAVEDVKVEVEEAVGLGGVEAWM